MDSAIIMVAILGAAGFALSLYAIVEIMAIKNYLECCAAKDKVVYDNLAEQMKKLEIRENVSHQLIDLVSTNIELINKEIEILKVSTAPVEENVEQNKKEE